MADAERDRDREHVELRNTGVDQGEDRERRHDQERQGGHEDLHPPDRVREPPHDADTGDVDQPGQEDR